MTLEQLEAYKENQRSAKLLEIEIQSMETEYKQLCEPSYVMARKLDGMPRGNAVSDPTARLGVQLAEAIPEAYTRVFELSDIRDARYTMPVKLLRFGKPASEATRERGRRSLANLRKSPGNYREVGASSTLDDRLQG